MKKTYQLQELASRVGADLLGDPTCEISGVAPLDQAVSGDLSFLSTAAFRASLASTHASAVILSPNEPHPEGVNVLHVADPHLAYAKLSGLFEQKPDTKKGVHGTAVLGEGCVIAETASIGPHCTLGARVHVGDHVVLSAGCVVGDDCSIGDATWLWANVTLYPCVQLGKRVLVHSGAVLGGDGFGLARDTDGSWVKVAQLGRLIIGDDVEIGANTTIDRGALGDSVIGEGVKLDNQIQLAHNINVGAHTVIAACTGIAGSVNIGKHCMIGGGSGIVDHLSIIDGVILTGGSQVSKSITEPGIYSSGTTLLPNRAWRKNVVRFRHLDELARRVDHLEKLHDSDER